MKNYYRSPSEQQSMYFLQNGYSLAVTYINSLLLPKDLTLKTLRDYFQNLKIRR